ncbi:MAG: DUF2975 domain-containing protein [Clostridia bacterium]|nr:DUF2975 domain-containing protein [Clostridia bacterium]
MMKWLDSPKVLFGLLRVVAVVAIAVGVWLSLSCGVLQALTGAEDAPAVGYVVTALVNCGLWCMAWCAFFGMCGRLMKGGSAFTQANSRALRAIGGCVALMAVVMCLRALPRLIAAPDVYLVIEAVILPGTFLTVSALAFILSRLLENAMALEEEQADVV